MGERDDEGAREMEEDIVILYIYIYIYIYGQDSHIYSREGENGRRKEKKGKTRAAIGDRLVRRASPSLTVSRPPSRKRAHARSRRRSVPRVRPRRLSLGERESIYI